MYNTITNSVTGKVRAVSPGFTINKPVTFRNWWGTYRYAKGTIKYQVVRLRSMLFSPPHLLFTEEHEAKIEKALDLLDEVQRDMFKEWPEAKKRIRKEKLI